MAATEVCCSDFLSRKNVLFSCDKTALQCLKQAVFFPGSGKNEYSPVIGPGNFSREILLYGISLCQRKLFSYLRLSPNCTVILKSFYLIFLSFSFPRCQICSWVWRLSFSTSALSSIYLSQAPANLFISNSVLVSTPGRSNQHSFKEGWFWEQEADVISLWLCPQYHAHQLSPASFILCWNPRMDRTKWTRSFCMLPVSVRRHLMKLQIRFLGDCLPL